MMTVILILLPIGGSGDCCVKRVLEVAWVEGLPERAREEEEISTLASEDSDPAL